MTLPKSKRSDILRRCDVTGLRTLFLTDADGVVRGKFAGFAGTSPCGNGCWQAYARKAGRKVALGVYPTHLEAAAAAGFARSLPDSAPKSAVQEAAQFAAALARAKADKGKSGVGSPD
jgi:hypothetical protein